MNEDTVTVDPETTKQYTITVDSELLQNYLQNEVLKPEAKFQALQTSSGAALLFSIGSDGVFYVTREVSGEKYGYARCDLSSAQIKNDLAQGGTVKNFAAAQCLHGPEVNRIHLAMVVNDGVNDHLYLSLNNSDTDASWADAPAWIRCPFNALDFAGKALSAPVPLRIVEVFISEATDKEYIVVDLVREPNDPVALVSRYLIDASSPNVPVWRLHDISIDLEVQGYTSCLGRRAPTGTLEKRHPIDGIYTSGEVGGRTQLIYTPLRNLFDPTSPPSPSRLELPGDAQVLPEAIAACRNPDNTSDLYVAASGALYYFASNSQMDGAVAIKLMESPLLTRVRNLFASVAGNTVTVWGLDGRDEIFYTSCPVDRLELGDSWSHPLPILGEVEQVSPYVNRNYGANSFFAHTGENKLTKAVKSPNTTLWNFRDVTLPPVCPTQKAAKFSTYTTHVLVNESDGNRPAGKIPVNLSASNVISVYINQLYYVLSPTPVQVHTDWSGSLTIVERVHDLAATQLTLCIDRANLTAKALPGTPLITLDTSTVMINPMDKAFQKLTNLTNKDKLRSATIRYPNGSTKPLVAPGTSDDLLKQVAAANRQLSKAYSSLTHRSPDVQPAPVVTARASARPRTDSILVEAGDFFCWLGHQIKRGVEFVVDLVQDAATGVYHFLANIAGQAYHAVLDAVEKVVAAAQWIYNTVKTAIQDLIQYLEFLFDWPDIQRTHDAIKKTTTLYLEHQLGQIDTAKKTILDYIDSLEKSIDRWANLSDLSGVAREAGSVKSSPAEHQSAAGSLLAHHLQHNGHNATFEPAGGSTELLGARGAGAGTPAPVAVRTQQLSDPVEELVRIITEEAEVIGEAFSDLKQVAENLVQMRVEEALKQLLAILSKLALEGSKRVIDVLLTILSEVGKLFLKILETPIHIPVLSDILEFFGVPKFSFLDIVCWVVAVPATLVYKVAFSRPPFPDNDQTRSILKAEKYQELLTALSPAPTSSTSVGLARTLKGVNLAIVESGGPSITQSSRAKHELFCGLHIVSGLAALFLGPIRALEAEEKNGGNWTLLSVMLGALEFGPAAVANAIDPHAPLKVKGVPDYVNPRNMMKAVRFAGKCYFSKYGQ